MSGMFRFLTAGESHGEALVAVIDGVPAGLPLAESHINEDLARRQRGYGRGGRMKIERDQVHILSGVRWGSTLGGPITLQIANRDWENWKSTMSVGPPEPGVAQKQITRPSDGRLAQAICSIPAIKGCELGLGFETARRPGSGVHDEILFDHEGGFRRSTNNAGGREGGVTNGQPVIARAAMKPLSTLRTPLRSVDLATKEAVEAVVERSDPRAVPAAGIVGEAMMAIVLAGAFLEKFGGDGLEEIRRNYETYLATLKTW